MVSFAPEYRCVALQSRPVSSSVESPPESEPGRENGWLPAPALSLEAVFVVVRKLTRQDPITVRSV